MFLDYETVKPRSALVSLAALIAATLGAASIMLHLFIHARGIWY